MSYIKFKFLKKIKNKDILYSVISIRFKKKNKEFSKFYMILNNNF